MSIAHVWRILYDIYHNGNETVGCVIRLTMSYQDYDMLVTHQDQDPTSLSYCYAYVFNDDSLSKVQTCRYAARSSIAKTPSKLKHCWHLHCRRTCKQLLRINGKTNIIHHAECVSGVPIPPRWQRRYRYRRQQFLQSLLSHETSWARLEKMDVKIEDNDGSSLAAVMMAMMATWRGQRWWQLEWEWWRCQH